MVQTKSDTYDDATESTADPSVINASGKDSDGEEDALQDPFMLAFVENFSQAVRRLAEANASNTGVNNQLCFDDCDLINSSIYVLLNMKLNLPENSETREVLSQNTNIVESLFQASGVLGDRSRRYAYYNSCNRQQKLALPPLFQLIGHFVSGRHVANIAAAYKNSALQRLHDKARDNTPSAVDSLVLLKLDDQAEPGLLGLDDVPTIVAAMKHHIKRGDAQEWGCSALKYILHHEETEDSRAPRRMENRRGRRCQGGATNEGTAQVGRDTTVKAEPALATGFGVSGRHVNKKARTSRQGARNPGSETPAFRFGSTITAPTKSAPFGAQKTFPNPNTLTPTTHTGPPAFGAQGVSNHFAAASTGSKDVAGAFTIAGVLEVIADGFTKHVDHAGANREVIGFLQNLVERYPAFKPPLVKLGLVQHLGNILQKKVLPGDVQAAAQTLIMAVVT